jgi:hypothetical protein
LATGYEYRNSFKLKYWQAAGYDCGNSSKYKYGQTARLEHRYSS